MKSMSPFLRPPQVIDPMALPLPEQMRLRVVLVSGRVYRRTVMGPRFLAPVARVIRFLGKLVATNLVRFRNAKLPLPLLFAVETAPRGPPAREAGVGF